MGRLDSLLFFLLVVPMIRFTSAFISRPARFILPLRLFASVTGTVYIAEDADAPQVRLFTREGCTLCDKVKDILVEVRDEHPHSLVQVDITDAEHKHYFDKYKYDIPVLHMETKFWIKHRLDLEGAKNGIAEAKEGRFEERLGDPNAAESERT